MDQRYDFQMETVMLPVQDCLLNVMIHRNDTADAVVVTLHGGPGGYGAKGIMEAPAMRVFERHFSMIYFDQRGCAGSSHYNLLKGLSREQVIEDAMEVIRYVRGAFEGKAVYLLGISYGGSLALLLLDQYPNAVEKAVICCPCITTLKTSRNHSAMKEMLAGILPILPANLQQMAEEVKDSDDFEAEFMRLINSDSFAALYDGRNDPPGFECVWHIYAMRAWYLKGFDMRPSLAKLSLPALLLLGVDDLLCPAQALTEAVKQTNNSKIDFRLLAHCGHNILVDAEKEATSLCISFYTDEP